MPPKRRGHYRGLYYHSSPPKILQMNGNSNEISGRGEKPKEAFVVKGSNIRIWIHDKDVAKLTKVLWAGQGNRLRAEASNNPRVRRFLDTVPNVLNSIKELHKAVVENDLEILQLLMEPRSVPRSLITSKDQNGLTVMHKAAGLAHTMIIEYLVQNWPDGVNDCDATGKTPLHWAASIKNNTRCYNLLVQAGADEEALDYRMKVPNYYRQKPGEVDRSLLTVLPDAPRVAQDSYPEWSALIDEPDFVYKPENKWESRGSDIMGDRFSRSREISFDNTSEPDMDDREGKQIAEEALKAALDTENNNDEDNAEADSGKNEDAREANGNGEIRDEEEGEGNDIFSREASPILEEPAEEKNSEEPETAEIEDSEKPASENALEESEIVNSTESEKTVDEDMSVSKVGTEEDQQNQSGDEGDCDEGENEKTELSNMHENPEQQQNDEQTISDKNIESPDNNENPGGQVENQNQTINGNDTNLNENKNENEDDKHGIHYEEEETTQNNEEEFEKEEQNDETDKETRALEKETHEIEKEDNSKEYEGKEEETNEENEEAHSKEEKHKNEEEKLENDTKYEEENEGEEKTDDEEEENTNNMEENLGKEFAISTSEKLISNEDHDETENEMNNDEHVHNEDDHLKDDKITENGKHNLNEEHREDSPSISENENESNEEYEDNSNQQISEDENSKKEFNGEFNDHIKENNPTEIRNWVNQNIQNEGERTPITREKTFINNLENEKNLTNNENYITDEEDDDDQVHVGTL